MNLGENFIRFLISLGVFSISLISFDCCCTLLYCYLLIAVTYIPLQHFGTYIDVCNDDRNYTVWCFLALGPFVTQTKSSKAKTAFSNYYDVKQA